MWFQCIGNGHKTCDCGCCKILNMVNGMKGCLAYYMCMKLGGSMINSFFLIEKRIGKLTMERGKIQEGSKE